MPRKAAKAKDDWGWPEGAPIGGLLPSVAWHRDQVAVVLAEQAAFDFAGPERMAAFLADAKATVAGYRRQTIQLAVGEAFRRASTRTREPFRVKDVLDAFERCPEGEFVPTYDKEGYATFEFVEPMAPPQGMRWARRGSRVALEKAPARGKRASKEKRRR